MLYSFVIAALCLAGHAIGLPQVDATPVISSAASNATTPSTSVVVVNATLVPTSTAVSNGSDVFPCTIYLPVPTCNEMPVSVPLPDITPVSAGGPESVVPPHTVPTHKPSKGKGKGPATSVVLQNTTATAFSTVIVNATEVATSTVITNGTASIGAPIPVSTATCVVIYTSAAPTVTANATTFIASTVTPNATFIGSTVTPNATFIGSTVTPNATAIASTVFPNATAV